MFRTSILTFFLNVLALSAEAQAQETLQTEHDLSRSELLRMFDPTIGINASGERAPVRLFRFPSDVDHQGLYGIDISHHNGDINWQRVGDGTGVAYAYIKATQGTSFVDRRFVTNTKKARDQGIPIGAYHFLSSLSNGRTQAEHFINVYGPHRKTGDLRPVLDLEWDALGESDRWAAKSKKQIVDEALIWLETVEANLSVEPIIYTNKAWWDQRVGEEGRRLNKYELWMARYGGYHLTAPALPDGFDWSHWQFTDRGIVNGISGGVDVNISKVTTDLIPLTEQECNLSDYLSDPTPINNSEEAALLAHISNTFGGVTQEGMEFLKPLLETADPRVIKRLISGATPRELDIDERDEYFARAKEFLAPVRYTQSQVDLLNILLATASPDAIRLCNLR